MPAPYAVQFSEITTVLAANTQLRAAVDNLAATEPMPGKATEGGNRLNQFRIILRDLIAGRIGFEEAILRTGQGLPRSESLHAASNKVFATGWEERLVRTQLSRCYNQAVIEMLLAEGHTSGFIPHSSEEDQNSRCTRELAGANQDLSTLFGRLVRVYREGNWNSPPAMIPDHPHCTHTITPPQ